MPETPNAPSLLEELDKRQDDVLTQLDELNVRIEKLLEEYTVSRSSEMQVANG